MLVFNLNALEGMLVRKMKGKVIAASFFLIVVLIGYTVWDNQRITVAKQDIIIKHLPKELEGFSIVQITDLHEKEFGENQERLINAINSIHYDAIVFTGDMMKNNSENAVPFYTLIEGIENKQHALFVHGNTDPKSYRTFSSNLEKGKFVKDMESKGVRLLDSTYTVKRGNAHVQFVNFDWSLKTENKSKTSGSHLSNNKGYPEKETSDLVIGLNHFPVVDSHIDALLGDPSVTFRYYDLIMAGHYHGGQFRIPFFGALFVPEAWYEKSGLFPPQDRVKGLWEYKHIKQYVSAGLGSNGPIPFLNFRFFDSPEINVLTFKSGKTE